MYLNVKSTIIAPYYTGDTILGIIFLTNTENVWNWSQQDIELLQDITNQISIGMHLFDLTNKLTKSLANERAIREIIMETRLLDNHDLVFEYLLKKLVDLFKVDRAIHVHSDENQNITVINDTLIDSNSRSILHQPILLAQYTRELEPKVSGQTIIITDIQTDIKDQLLIDYLTDKNILSFMIYPISKGYKNSKEKEETASIMLCSSKSRIWTQNEIDSFRLAVDTTSLVCLELRQKQEAI